MDRSRGAKGVAVRDVQRGRQAAMSSSGWEDASDVRGRSYRAGRQGDVDRAAGRSSDRASRDGNPAPRAYDRMDRGSSRGWDESPGRPSPRSERPRDDDWSSAGSGRSGTRSQRGGPGGPTEYDRSPRERAPRRDDDPRERQGDRSQRGPRPAPRDMDGRPRAGGPSPDAQRRPASGRGGGIWGDEDDAPRRRRPDASDPRGRSAGERPGSRDPRNMRRGLVNLEDEPEEEEKKGSFGLGKAVLIVLLMLLVGAGGAYGYYTFTTPAVHNAAPPASATSSTPSVVTTTTASPSASASATAHS